MFIEDYIERKNLPKYENNVYGFPVVTRQEKELKLSELNELKKEKTVRGRFEFTAEYE